MTGRQPIGDRRMTEAERKARSRAAKLFPTGVNPGSEDRARLARAQASLASLKAKKLAGMLIDAQEVKNTWVSVMASVRARLLAVPARVAQTNPRLAQGEIEAIDREIREALSELADDGEGKSPETGAFPAMSDEVHHPPA